LDRTQLHMAPQIGQYPNRVSLWECAVVVRVVVRMLVDAGSEVGRGDLLGAERRARPPGNVGAHGHGLAWLTQTGPPGRLALAPPQAEARPRIGAELLR